MAEAAYDALVIGGGPAGCSAAIGLARQGVRVALLEARAYPHDKLCGEFLSPECAGLLAGLGLGGCLAALGARPIETAHVSAPGGVAWQARLPGTAYGLTRRALDAALAQQARAQGAEVCTGAEVVALGGSLASGFEVITHGGQRARARLVIAAHGKRAALDRRLGRRFVQRRQPFVALKAHFRGPPLPGRIDLHGFRGGYCGMSEVEDGQANLCLLAREAVFRAAGAGPERLAAFVRWMQDDNPRLGAWLRRAERCGDWLSIGQVAVGPKRAVEGDVLMAGDAAGLIAPLAGDGIAMALRGGQIAAACAAHYLDGSRTAAQLRRGYARAWRREFGPRLVLARALQAWLFHPQWLAAGLRLLCAAPGLGNWIVASTRGPTG